MSDKVETRGLTPLMKAACDGITEDVRRLIADGSDVNEKIGDDWTALMCAIYAGHEEVVGLLLEAGADKEQLTSQIPPFNINFILS